MSGVKPEVGQSNRDGLSIQRIISDLKKVTNPVEEKLGANGSSSSRKSNATSLKMLLAKEMAKEVESKRRPPSVIARLMGLEEDSPTEEPIVQNMKSNLSSYLNATNNALQEIEHHQPMMLKIQSRHPCDEKIKYNDIYEVSEEQSGRSNFQDQTSQKGTKAQECMEPKRLVFKEKLLCTKNLPEAFDVPCSNKGLFLELPEEHNPTFSRQLSGLHRNGAAPQTKHITVLKPIISVDVSGARQFRAEQVGKQNALNMRRFDQIPSSKEEISSQTSRIILLRPTPGKPGIPKAKLTPRATSFQLTNRNVLSGSSDINQTTIGSSGLVRGSMQHRLNGCHQRDDSLLSSAYSNGYGADESSFSDSEADHNSGSEIDDITPSNSEGGSPLSKYSENYIRRYEGQCTSSSFSQISHFSESSVIREAKRQLSERWAMVTCDETSQVQPPKRKCTLGEMLSIKDDKKEYDTTGTLSVSSNQSCCLENELSSCTTCVTASRKNDNNDERSSRKFPRSKAVPVLSSRFDNMVVGVQASDPEGRRLKGAAVSNKGKTAFKGRVSEIVLSRSKKPRRQASTYHPSDCFADRLEACVVHSRLDYNHNLDANEKAMHCGFDSFSTQISASMSDRTSGASESLGCSSRNLDKLGVTKGLNSKRDQPSPTSVLDVPSEDSSCNEPETSGRTTSKNGISRSSAIKTVTRFLSLDDIASESQSLCNPRLTSLLSDVDDDESECHVLVQNLLSSAGLGSSQSSMVFSGWHLPDHPLDPVLCNKVLELQEKSSYRRLLFDCVNVALVEIGENTLLSAFLCSKRHSRTWRRTSSPDLNLEVWSILKDWIYGAQMFVVSNRDNTGVILDKIVKQDIEGRTWMNMMMAQVVDIIEQLEGGVLEKLVEEAVLDFAVCVPR